MSYSFLSWNPLKCLLCIYLFVFQFKGDDLFKTRHCRNFSTGVFSAAALTISETPLVVAIVQIQRPGEEGVEERRK